MFINLKQNKTEVLFFSHFTLCCLSNEFFWDYYELEPQAQRSIALIVPTSCQKTISFTNHQLHTKRILKVA